MVALDNSAEDDDGSQPGVTLQVGVKLLCVDQDQRVLLLRRNETKYALRGQEWDFAGGRIEPGEPILDALKREVTEETGLAVDPNPELVMAQDIFDVPGRHVVRLTFQGTAGGTVILDQREHVDYGWFERSTLPSLLSNGGLNKYCIEALSTVGWLDAT